MGFYASLNDKLEKFREIQHDITYLEARNNCKKMVLKSVSRYKVSTLQLAVASGREKVV